MAFICEYCRGTCEEGLSSCQNCGAPVQHTGTGGLDIRFCPFCKRRLLTVGSPACNYCGKTLPDEYLLAHNVSKQRIEKLTEESKQFTDAFRKIEPSRDIEEIFGARSGSTAKGILDFVDDLLRK